MTEISDDEAAEVLWASSEQGQAAVRAGWARLLQLRNGNPISLGIADVSAIVYAAHLAAGRDSEGPPGR